MHSLPLVDGFWQGVATVALGLWDRFTNRMGRGVRGVYVVAPSTDLGAVFERPHARMRLEAPLHVANDSDRAVKFLAAELVKLNQPGIVQPERHGGVLPHTSFQITGAVEPEGKETVVCTFWVAIPESPRGGYVTQPWEFRSQIMLLDDRKRRYRTRKLAWRS